MLGRLPATHIVVDGMYVGVDISITGTGIGMLDLMSLLRSSAFDLAHGRLAVQ